MAKANDKRNLPVTFVGLNDDEKAPFFAAYQVNSAGQPVKENRPLRRQGVKNRPG